MIAILWPLVLAFVSNWWWWKISIFHVRCKYYIGILMCSEKSAVLFYISVLLLYVRVQLEIVWMIDVSCFEGSKLKRTSRNIYHGDNFCCRSRLLSMWYLVGQIIYFSKFPNFLYSVMPCWSKYTLYHPHFLFDVFFFFGGKIRRRFY